MKKILFLMALLLITCRVFAQEHNAQVSETGTYTTTVIKPLLIYPPNNQSGRVFEIINGQIKAVFENNEWHFNVNGEPGRAVQVNFFGPVPINGSVGVPTLTGNWYYTPEGGSPQVQGQQGVFDLPIGMTDSFFDVFYRLDEINASQTTGATIGLKNFELNIEFFYYDM